MEKEADKLKLEVHGMSTNAKRAIVYVIGGIGFIFLLLGTIADIYPTTTGIILLFVFGIIATGLAKFWGIKKEKDS
ncbi:hypothetical protein ACFLVZ_01125 [Chloroflexota bacterium]